MTIRITFTRALGISAVLLITGVVLAADHADGPAASLDKTADIADVFSWASADGKTTYFGMDLGKDMQAGSKFSNAVKYVFHTASMSAYGATTGVKSLDIICTFDAATAQKATCWIGSAPVKDYLSGDASTALMSASGKVKLFAGLRDDPFFFNLDGFNHVASEVHAAAGTLTFDASGCPAVGASGPVLAGGLAQNLTGGTPPVDAFAAFNTLAIVLAVDTTLVNEGGPIVSVWASTNK